MRTLWQDLRYGLRMLVKSPGFTVVAILALAIGIGANSAIFSVVNAVLLRPLPYGDPDRLVVVWETNPKLSTPSLRVRNEASPANYFDWREQNRVFEQLAAFRWETVNLTGKDMPEQLVGNRVSGNMFTTLQVKPMLGRVILPEDDKPDGERVVVLSHGLWQRRFGNDPQVIGQSLILNGQSYTVIGVMPPEFEFPNARPALWMPLSLSTEAMQNRRSHYLYTRARLKPGVTLEQAQAEMDTIAARLRQQYPDTNTDRGVRLVPLHADAVEFARPALLVLLGAVGFVLLIACANVANLMLARASARQKEMAIRTALGASRFRVIRQLLTESMLLSLVGGTGGLLLALWGVDLLTASIPSEMAAGIPGWTRISLDLWVLVFTLVISILTGILFGLVPALQVSKSDLNETLKEGGRTATGGSGRQRFRGLLVVTEVALALVLLVGAGLMMKSFLRLLEVRPGFDPQNVLTMELVLPRFQYSENKKITAFFTELLRRIGSQPGVEAVGAINYLPMSGSGGTTTLIFEGRPAPPPGQYPEVNARIASPGYFHALRIPVLKGRDFTDRDTEEKPRVVIINETMARLYYPNEDPIGKRVRNSDGTNPAEIVGVVGDVKHWGLDDNPEAFIYVSHAQVANRGMTLVVRTASDPGNMIAMVRREVSALDKDQPIFNIKTMEERISASSAMRRLPMFLLGIFAVVAMTLAAVGIYGVIAYSVTRRTHEIGVRMALGAQRSDILKLVVRQGMTLVLIGITLGLITSFAVTRVMQKMLFEVSPSDPTTFAGISMLLVAVALIACFIPARRATKVDPMIALRYE